MGKSMTIGAISVVVLACVCVTQAEGAPGDLNCDTTVNGLDVSAFVLALIDPSGYEAAYPCGAGSSDLDCGEETDTDDIPLFVDCVLGGVCDPCGVVIETVIVGNPGNPGEQSRIQNGDHTFYGGVAYTYSIGKYEVTAG